MMMCLYNVQAISGVYVESVYLYCIVHMDNITHVGVKCDFHYLHLPPYEIAQAPDGDMQAFNSSAQRIR